MVTKRAEASDASAQFNLGCYHDYGMKGLPKNKKLAVEWLAKAAEQGHDRAQFNLAVIHRDGDGVKVDSKEAAKFFKASAEAGHIPAMTEYGSALCVGRGVPLDLDAGVVWLEKGSAAGDPVAKSQLLRCQPKPSTVGVRCPKRARKSSNTLAPDAMCPACAFPIDGHLERFCASSAALKLQHPSTSNWRCGMCRCFQSTHLHKTLLHKEACRLMQTTDPMGGSIHIIQGSPVRSGHADS
jgi:TPR repeat protein